MTSLMTGSDTSVKIEPTWNEVKDNIQGSSSMLTVNICLFGTLCDFFVTIDVFFCDTNDLITDDCPADLPLEEKKAKL